MSSPGSRAVRSVSRFDEMCDCRGSQNKLEAAAVNLDVMSIDTTPSLTILVCERASGGGGLGGGCP